MRRYSILTLFFIAICIISCNKRKETPAIFSVIENLIETNTDSAFMLLNESYNTIANSSQFNTAYYNLLLAEVNSKIDNLSLAHDSLLDASINYFEDYNNPELYARSLIYKGRLWSKMNQNKDALTYYHKALDILNSVSGYKTITKLYDDLGILYVNEGLYDEAMTMFQKAYIQDSIHDNKDNMVLSLANLAKANLYINETNEHIRYIQKAYEIANLSNNPQKQLSYLDYFYSIYYTEVSDYHEALKSITRSINNHFIPDDIFIKYYIKGEIYNALNEYDSAHYYLIKSLDTNKLHTKILAYSELSSLYKSQRDFEKAIEYIDLYQTGVDSITYLTFNTETQALAYKYNTEKVVLKVNSKNRILLLTIIIIFSTTTMLSFSFYHIRDKKMKLRHEESEKEILRNKTEILKKEIEIDDLKEKMQHFKLNISEYQQLELKLNQYNELIELKEKELFNLRNKDIEEQCTRFKKTKIYQKILELSLQKKDRDNKILTYIEQDKLLKEIKISFSRLIDELKQTYPFLNDEDLLVCCLSILNFSTNTISLCFAVSGSNAIKQRKHRMKLKMAESSKNSFLYNLIFPEKK